MQFKQRIIHLGIGSAIWLASQVVVANTVLLDPATLEVGASVGEHLVVKESCPDPSKTNCQATEKMKYITAVTGRIGKIEFDVNLTDNFELNVNVDWANLVQQAITLFKVEYDNDNSLYIRFDSLIRFNDDNRWNSYSSLGWQLNSINNFELSAQNSTAYLNINGTPFKDYSGEEGDTVALDTSKPFVKLVIAGIKEADRLFEVTVKGGIGSSTTPTTGGGDFDSGKQAGIQQCVSDPASCGITVSAGNSGISTGGAHATYSPATGEVHIPFIDVPGPFGGIQTYEVYLLQQPLTFAFDLDMNRINMR